MRSGIVRKDSMWDKLIFNKVQVTQDTSVFEVETGEGTTCGRLFNSGEQIRKFPDEAGEMNPKWLCPA